MILSRVGALITWHRITRLSSFSSVQLVVQLIGFVAGIVLVRHMAQAEYGYFTLAMSAASVTSILTDLGLATAVMAIGGRLLGQPRSLGALVSEAHVLHLRLAALSVAVLLPCIAALLLAQHATLWQALTLGALVVAAAGLNVRVCIALSITRLLGNVALQQKLDLAINCAKLGVLWAATWLTLDAAIACWLNLAVAAAYFLALRSYLSKHVQADGTGSPEHAAALRDHLCKQAPNSVYFVLSSQLAVWLIAIFGSAERVAEVGALGRLAAVFTLIGVVTGALVMPYFARHEAPAQIGAGFFCVSAFFAALLALLVALAMLWPEPILWILGGPYARLHTELVWMIVASTLSAWAATIYNIGCARGWVMPVGLAVSTGAIATATAAALVDVSTVRGSFIINTATGLVGTLVATAFFGWQLRGHARLMAARP